MSDTTAPPPPSAFWTGPVIVSILVLGIFTLALVAAWWSKNENLGMMLGAAAGNASIAVGYWLGSSSSSRAKDAIIAAKPPTGTGP